MKPIDWHIEDKNDKALERAAAEGDLDAVMALTTSKDPVKIADINCGFNYPLRAACLHGQLKIIDFLLNHPDPQKRKSQNTPEALLEALSVAIDHGQNKVVMFFKKYAPKEFAKYMASGNQPVIDRHLDILTMRGKLSTIQLLQTELPLTMTVSYVPLLLGKALQYKHSRVFDYWLNYASSDLFEQKIEKIKKIKLNTIEINNPISSEARDLVHTALYHKKTHELKRLVEKFNLNLTDLIDTQTFKINIEISPKSLYYIVEELGYKPNERLHTQILEHFKNMPHDHTDYKSFSHFIKLLQIKEEKDMLLKTIAPVDLNGKNGLKADKKTHKV